MIPILETSNTRLAAEKLWKSIEAKLGEWKSYDKTDVDKWVTSETNGKYSLKEIVVATPEKLVEISTLLRSLTKQKCSRYKQIDEKGEKRRWEKVKEGYPTLELYESFFSDSSKYIGTSETNYSSLELVSDLGITVCPYCNRQYINNASKKRSS